MDATFGSAIQTVDKTLYTLCLGIERLFYHQGTIDQGSDPKEIERGFAKHGTILTFQQPFSTGGRVIVSMVHGTGPTSAPWPLPVVIKLWLLMMVPRGTPNTLYIKTTSLIESSW